MQKKKRLPLFVLCSRNDMRSFFGACVVCVQVYTHGWDDSVKLSFLLPLLLKWLAFPSQREHVVGQASEVVLVALIQLIKTCEMFQSRVEVIEEKQFPTEESTPLISLGLFCTLSILLFHFISPLPCSGNQSCCGQIKTTVL